MGQIDQISYLNEDPDIIVITTDSGEPITSAATTDSIYSDTAVNQEHTVHLLDFSIIAGKVCTYSDLPVEPGQFGYRQAYSAGIPAEARPVLPGYDTGVAGLVLGIFLFVALNLRHYSTFLKGFARDLFSVKLQDNLFEDHTVTETRVVLSLVLLLCMSAGIIINGVVDVPFFDAYSPAVPISAFSIGMGIYYLCQIMAYDIVGYTFTSKERKEQWVRGFNASQVLLGLVLWIPALIMLFDPAQCGAMFILAAILYLIARIIFIIKGFRIFYNNIFSLIYFILYLCSLEIIPLLIAYNIINYLTLS